MAPHGKKKREKKGTTSSRTFINYSLIMVVFHFQLSLQLGGVLNRYDVHEVDICADKHGQKEVCPHNLTVASGKIIYPVMIRV